MAVFGVLAAALVARGGDDAPPAGRSPNVQPLLLRTYIEGEITPGKADSVVAELRRWLNERPEIGFIVLQLDTPGGEVDSVQRLSHFLFNDLKHIRTVAFIPPGRYAYSGGAIVAVAAREIVMGSNSHMGAAAPVAVTGADVKELGEKFQAPVREILRTYAEDRGYPTILTDAMVSKDHDEILRVRFTNPDETKYYYRRDFEGLDPERRLRRVEGPTTVVAKGELLVVNEKKALELGFIRHVADDLTQLRNALGLPIGNEHVFDTREGRLRAEFAGGQAVVDFFHKPLPRFLLILGGCLGVLIELKTFGLLVPGLVAAACFLTLFVTSLFPVTGSLEGTATAWECLLFVLGAGLVALEFLLLPGMAVFAITGGALCLVGLVLAMVPAGTADMEGAMTIEDAIGILALGFGGGAAAFLMILRFLPHNPLFARRGLVSQSAIVGVPTADSAIASQERDMSLLGKTGTAMTALHPAGKMETEDGEILDVIAQGQFVEQGTSVKIIEARGGQVRVERTAGS